MIGIHSNIVDWKQTSVMDTSSNCTGDAVSFVQALTKQVEDLQAKLLTTQTQLQQKEHECAELAEKLSACMEFVPVCPITQGPMRDPILCTVDSRVYEKTALEQWLQRSSTSPITRAPIDSSHLLKFEPKAVCDIIRGGCNEVATLRDELAAANELAVAKTSAYYLSLDGVEYTGMGELHENGNIVFTGEWKDGEFHTHTTAGKRSTLYYPSGTIKYQGEFEEGEYHGEGCEYHPNGKLKYSGEFEEGEYSGFGWEYGPNGELKYKGYFENGLLDAQEDSSAEEFYDNGKLRYHGNFEEGVADGYGFEYHMDGTLKRQGYFEKGHFVEAAECPY